MSTFLFELRANVGVMSICVSSSKYLFELRANVGVMSICVSSSSALILFAYYNGMGVRCSLIVTALFSYPTYISQTHYPLYGYVCISRP